MKKNIAVLTILSLIICALLLPIVSADCGILAVTSVTEYGSGDVDNEDNITGSSPDDEYAHISGVVSYGDGGNIVGVTPVLILSGSTIKIYAFSSYGYYSNVHVYVSSSSNGPWYEVGDGVEVSSGPDWYNFGYTTRTYRYVAVASIYEGGEPTNVYIDCVKIFT